MNFCSSESILQIAQCLAKPYEQEFDVLIFTHGVHPFLLSFPSTFPLPLPDFFHYFPGSSQSRYGAWELGKNCKFPTGSGHIPTVKQMSVHFEVRKEQFHSTANKLTHA